MEGPDNREDRLGSKMIGDANEGIVIKNESGKIANMLNEQDRLITQANSGSKSEFKAPKDKLEGELPDILKIKPHETKDSTIADALKMFDKTK